MQLRALTQDENKTEALFASENAQQLLNIYDGYYKEQGFDPPWVAYLVIEDDQVLGTCSFTRKPMDGKVEIAYWTFSDFEGKGVASFGCSQLVDIAKQNDPTITIAAKTAPEHNASTKILERNGFVFSKVVQDDDIGDAWLWVLKPSLS